MVVLEAYTKRGIVDVGGGMRDIFGAGILDRCIDAGIHFDYCAGVSAGGANLANFLANQKERAKRFYLDYAFRKEYMSVWNFIRIGSYVNLEYAYGTLSNSTGEDPLDFTTMQKTASEFCIVAANAQTGETKYFSMTDLSQDNYGPLKASACVPVACKPWVIDGVPYLDGGMADPIPYKKAFDAGCEHVTVVLTRPKDFYRNPEADRRSVKILRRSYPKAAELLEKRAELYNSQLDEIKALEQEGRISILAPASIEGLGTLTKDKEKLSNLYAEGYEAAQRLFG
ncbi:MAG: patatin family protein [Coriobacteriales bacterium]|nr:patatin family protein [Coriobacteriales bacterium]